MDFTRLDAFMQEMPMRGYPSSELVVSLGGKTVYRTSVGYSDEEKTKPCSPNDLYWMYSCSKVITCISALRLLEEGKISLDDPVKKYLPEYANVTVQREDGTITAAERTMTLLHLFTMTGGLGYNSNLSEIEKAKTPDATTRSIVRAIAEVPLLFEPGTHYRYSFCHDVLGAVIEVVSGMRLSEYMKKYIFDPLGLKNIGFHPTEEQLSRFADMYVGNSATNRAKKMTCSNDYEYSPLFDGGGAGLFSSADDYSKIIATIANGGTTADGYTILHPETIALAEVNRLDDVALTEFCAGRLYGYGWGLCGRVHRDPRISFSLSPVGEFGWDSAANSLSVIDTKNKLSFIFTTHVRGYEYGYNYIHPMLRNAVYECMLGNN